MSVAVGLQVMAERMDDELTATVGSKHAKLADPTAVRWDNTTGSVVLGGRKIAVRRPEGLRRRWSRRSLLTWGGR